MKFLREVIEDASGGASTARLNALLVNLAAIAIFGGIAISNCYVAAKTRSVAKVPEGFVLYAGAIAALKVGQRWIEEGKSE